MKSKKLLSLLLALAMVMSMAACGAKTNEPPATSGTPSETGAPATEELNWPTKEITLIQPWSLGGGPDVITRQIASYSDKILGVPMIVENHTGGSGTIGMNDFLEAEDDGYTLFCCNGPLFSLTPSFIDVDYTIDDISPICGIRITEFVILSNASSKITNIQELKDYAAAGHTVKYATTGGPGWRPCGYCHRFSPDLSRLCDQRSAELPGHLYPRRSGCGRHWPHCFFQGAGH